MHLSLIVEFKVGLQLSYLNLLETLNQFRKCKTNNFEYLRFSPIRNKTKWLVLLLLFSLSLNHFQMKIYRALFSLFILRKMVL